MVIKGMIIKDNHGPHFVGIVEVDGKETGYVNFIPVLTCESQDSPDDNFIVLCDEDKNLCGFKHIEYEGLYILRFIDRPEDRGRLNGIIDEAMELQFNSRVREDTSGSC